MSSLTNINNNSSVVNVGRTTPVLPGAQEAAKSIPVVLATDQQPVPVVEQNKIQSEVALSLLGIPRSEVALGIFADVNTYDINPTEWSKSPEDYTTGYGVKHLPEEAGALVEAPKDEVSILTSKRFFRYQPGRVSSATFGVKSTISPSVDLEDSSTYDLNPAIRKYGIFDKLDGYYWETKGDGTGDNFCVVRRTQSLLKYNPIEYGTATNFADYRISGKPANDEVVETNQYPNATNLLKNERFEIVEDAFTSANTGITDSEIIEKCHRDMDLAIDAYILDLQYGGNAHSYVHATTYRTALGSNAPEEGAVHEALRDEIVAKLTAIGETAAANRVTTDLSGIIINAANGSVVPDEFSDLSSIDYGNRSKLSTIFSIYNRYLGYIVSESISSNNYVLPSGYPGTVEDIKYKCLRDVRYITEGYARDLEFGGNFATVYNAKNYYFGNIIQVYSQTQSGIVAEIERHEYLRDLISANTTVEVTRSDDTSVNVISVFDLFDIRSENETRFDELSTIIIDNFTNEYSGNIVEGNAAQYGDLILYRDGLLMIHAAAHDPSLLKPKRQIVVKVDATNNTLTTGEDEFVEGQYINFYGTTTQQNHAGLTANKLYRVKKVRGHKGNIIELADPLAVDPNATVSLSSATEKVYIEPNVPFIFPDNYYVGNTENPERLRRTDWQFPYLYSTGSLPHEGEEDEKVGYIDTALLPAEDSSTILSQIDSVNLIYNNWIKQNVDPRYYAVYEYRVPRSRFSQDHLNAENNDIVYSDVASSTEGTVYPGFPVKTNGGAQLQSQSAWNIDFGKVAMLKIEFSWYGAVGALFLAYVPVGNGEARWVRVHHLRASNQLKISSLGNATLPITYLTYGGGSVNRLGIADTVIKQYNSTSDHIVKYGASYYIDCGDRGTVRLYSHSNDDTTEVFGSKYSLGTLTLQTENTGPLTGLSYFDISSTQAANTELEFFMKAKLTTSNRADQGTNVIWVDDSAKKIYINKTSLNSTAGLNLITNRPSLSFGLKAKQNIVNQTGFGVRNRVQVYPTKLAIANIGSKPVKTSIFKTPLFQPNITTSGNLNLSSSYTITAENLPLSVSNTDYLANNGDFVYGWFRANVGSVFGRLTKRNDAYFFTLLETYSVPVILTSNINFLKEKRFDIEGNVISGTSETDITKERLSSVFISNQIQTPIPETGTEIASFFVGTSTEQYDLLSYFDYNKDYLSFPLTNEIESLYVSSSSVEEYDGNVENNILVSLTWEEQ